ncbi:MAG: hypothetical protein KY446_06000 [Proteobacteria bacterium]|nr:hypothetical protein [Pseudomonadota bacterium]MBW3617294.1 hypothetical protein [Pseudomonadota bacterium]
MELIVCPLHEVRATLASAEPSHLVTLASPNGPAALLEYPGSRLTLTFHDIAEPRPGLNAVSTQDLVRLLAFARTWPRSQPMLIHCWAGVSRSPAAAYAIACASCPPGAEAALAIELRTAAPFATPNPRIVALADDLLQRGGAMTRAIAGLGRGRECYTGTTFRLPATG